MFLTRCSVMSWCMHVQVPWGMVTGPDGNLYIAMDDEFQVCISLGALFLWSPGRDAAVKKLSYQATQAERTSCTQCSYSSA